MSENKEMPRPSAPEPVIEHSEKGALRGSAAVVGMTPSDQFVAPVMNLDGPPPGPPAHDSSDE